MSKRRMSNVSHMESIESSGSESGSNSDYEECTTQYKRARRDSDSDNNVPCKKEVTRRKPTRMPKVNSRNAIMARQNRIKKKKYIEDLERQVENLKAQVKALKSVTHNQSGVIIDHRKEIKYLKNVLSNQSTISKLLRPIQENINKGVDNCSCKTVYPDWPSPESAEDYDVSYDEYFPSSIRSNEFYDIPNPADFNISDDDFPIFDDTPALKVNQIDALNEHNYTATKSSDTDTSDEDAGICLHISKQKISLEFCNLCNDNAHKKDALTEDLKDRIQNDVHQCPLPVSVLNLLLRHPT